MEIAKAAAPEKHGAHKRTSSARQSTTGTVIQVFRNHTPRPYRTKMRTSYGANTPRSNGTNTPRPCEPDLIISRRSHVTAPAPVGHSCFTAKIRFREMMGLVSTSSFLPRAVRPMARQFTRRESIRRTTEQTQHRCSGAGDPAVQLSFADILVCHPDGGRGAGGLECREMAG